MRTLISVDGPACLAAVRQYAGELRRAGLPVRIEEIPIDDGWTQGTALSIEWGAPEAAGQDWEVDDAELEGGEEAARRPSEQELDDGQGRLAAHYLRTLQLLARNAETARNWTDGRRRSRKKKAR